MPSQEFATWVKGGEVSKYSKGPSFTLKLENIAFRYMVLQECKLSMYKETSHSPVECASLLTR